MPHLSENSRSMEDLLQAEQHKEETVKERLRDEDWDVFKVRLQTPGTTL